MPAETSVSGRAVPGGAKRGKRSEDREKSGATADLEMLMMDDGALLAAREGALPPVLRAGVATSAACQAKHHALRSQPVMCPRRATQCSCAAEELLRAC